MSTWSLPLTRTAAVHTASRTSSSRNSSNAVQRHLPCSSKRSRIVWMCSDIALSSTILRFFNFFQRTEGGVPARNPKKRCLISVSVNLVRRALRITTKRCRVTLAPSSGVITSDTFCSLAVSGEPTGAWNCPIQARARLEWATGRPCMKEAHCGFNRHQHRIVR